jgi:hypothetical protein
LHYPQHLNTGDKQREKLSKIELEDMSTLIEIPDPKEFPGILPHMLEVGLINYCCVMNYSKFNGLR